MLPACNDTRTLLPTVSGKAGEIIVVMEKSEWENTLGADVREVLASDCPWLAQKEPLYRNDMASYGCDPTRCCHSPSYRTSYHPTS